MSKGKPGSSFAENQARKLAHDFIEYGLRLYSTLSGRPPSPDELVRLMRLGIAVETSLRPILGDSSPLVKPTEAIEDGEALISSHPATEVVQEIENSLVQEWVKLRPEEIAKLRAAVDTMREWSQQPTWPKRALIAFAKQTWRGKPGPTPKVPREAYPELVAKAVSLRPVCEMVLDFARKSKRPFAKVIEAVMILEPDWERECSFMLCHEELVQEALQTAKIRRALRARSKAHLLADALACTYAGCPARPSYSIQIVAEARRLSKH